jgi:FMN phosphatase YigB (HAD superfamily)
MKKALTRGLAVLKAAVERHGGGWYGIRSVGSRAYKVFRTLGWKGFVQRLAGSSRRISGLSSLPHPTEFAFPHPVPLGEITLRTGVMAHVFYADLIEEFIRDLSRIPIPFVLMVSVVDEATRTQATARFSTLRNAVKVDVRLVPNRGRDIAPMLVAFREEIRTLDVVCHIHTKKSLYTGNELGNWRRYLVDSLLGSESRIAWILGMFQATPELGMVYPESFATVPLTAHTWLSNKDHARLLGSQLGIEVDPDAYLDFAAGSMFWVRVEALRPLLSLGLTVESFPEEMGQTDGTLQHTIERMFVQALRQRGMIVGVLPSNGNLTLNTEGARNWETYFDMAIADRIAVGAIDAEVISFDLFDTLVLRPFLKPTGAREYLGYLVKKQFAVDRFPELRESAESRARQAAGQDVDTATIYTTMSGMSQAKGIPVESILALELATEKRQLRPRQALLDAAAHMGRVGKTVIAVSDMYLSMEELRSVLPAAVNDAVAQILVSCETGWRKDTGAAWESLPGYLGTDAERWLHVGDNEHSDIQLPFALGFVPPVHVLRTHALLDVVPALRPLRPTQAQLASWPNQLWLGLVGNRLLELADRDPGAFDAGLFIEDPQTLGYAVLGPLVLDYLTWMTRLASTAKADAILFLSREGFLLKKAYDILCRAVPGEMPRSVYLLASRRGVGTPSLRLFSDVDQLLGGTYTGSLHDLLSARMGTAIAELGMARLGSVAMGREVYLPEMRSRVIQMLEPIADDLLEIAELERTAYSRYWHEHAAASHPIVADLGYAGTIQSHLSRLTGTALGGAYFALNAQAKKLEDNGNWAQARYCDLRGSEVGSSPVMDHHLLLESILTSPDGQFSHFQYRHGRLHAVHVAQSNPSFRSVAQVHRGVELFISDVCDVVGEDVLQVELDTVLVQEALRCVGKGHWRTADWLSQLNIDDHFTGRGSTSAQQT